MKTHPDNFSILEVACISLMRLAFNTNNQVAIAAAGGIAVRIAALGHRSHVTDPPPPPHVPPAPTSEESMTPDVTICPYANSNKNETQIHLTLTKSSLSVTPIVSKLDLNHNLNPDATPTLTLTRYS